MYARTQLVIKILIKRDMKMTLTLGKQQKYNNIIVVPVLKDSTSKLDILDLKTGFEMGLVDVSECEHSVVETIMVKNDATNPLILIDGEEVAGAKQNRIIGQTMLIPPKINMPIPVNCSEKGRWTYKSEFKPSNYMANSETRLKKAFASMGVSRGGTQGAVWDSIDILQEKRNSFSNTSALRDNYEKNEKINTGYLEHFQIQDNQVGIIAVLGRKVGVDIFSNPTLYKKYNDMILKSYIIDDVYKKTHINDNLDFEAILDNINEKYFTKRNTIGLGQSYTIKSPDGFGSSLVYEDELIHANFFYSKN